MTIKHYDIAWNPIRGCTPTGVGLGCEHCCAINNATRLDPKKRDLIIHQDLQGRPQWNGKIILDPVSLYEPLRHKKPTTFMVGTLGDMFHPDVDLDELAAVYGMMAVCKTHRFLLCTKFPERVAVFYDYLREGSEEGLAIDAIIGNALDDLPGCCPNGPSAECAFHLLLVEARNHPEADQGPIHRILGPVSAASWPLTNLWVGTSASNQADADRRWDRIEDVPAAGRFMVFEPLLEQVSMLSWATQPDWVLIGGELGVGARPCRVDWIRSLLASRRTPHYVMSLGNNAVNGNGDRCFLKSRNASSTGEWPEDVRVRDVPWGDDD